MAFKIRAHSRGEALSPVIVRQAGDWVDRVRAHRRWFAAGTGLVLAAMVTASAVWFVSRGAERAASALEMEASRLFHDPPPLPQPKEEGKPLPPQEETDKTARLKKAAHLYDEILEKYPRSSSARVALYSSGHAHFELREYPLAEQKYLDFLRQYPHENEWVALVRLKLGILRQINGDQAAALQHLRAVYTMEGVRIRDQAGFELGRLLEKGTNKEEAIAIYKRVSEDFSESPWGTEAKARLNVLAPSPTVSAPAASSDGAMSPPTMSVSVPSPLKVIPAGAGTPTPPTPVPHKP